MDTTPTPVVKKTGLELLREPFPARLISKLPKPTKQQTEAVKQNYKMGVRCAQCGSWHHPDVVHLDYVGHAALTHRLLDADLAWKYEPLSVDATGLPVFDQSGGLWIKLTVCGVTRLGYGHAETKPQAEVGARTKEVIGDALRNAAMRFGAALDLWSKADLHADDCEDTPKPDEPKRYPDADFTKNSPEWTKAIQSGKKTAAEVIAMIETKGKLSDAQKAKLTEIKRVRTKAEVETAMRAATDVEELAAILAQQACDVPGKEDQAELAALYNELELKLSGGE
jgi:hypothetical protein